MSSKNDSLIGGLLIGLGASVVIGGFIALIHYTRPPAPAIPENAKELAVIGALAALKIDQQHRDLYGRGLFNPFVVKKEEK